MFVSFGRKKTKDAIENRRCAARWSARRERDGGLRPLLAEERAQAARELRVDLRHPASAVHLGSVFYAGIPQDHVGKFSDLFQK